MADNRNTSKNASDLAFDRTALEPAQDTQHPEGLEAGQPAFDGSTRSLGSMATPPIVDLMRGDRMRNQAADAPHMRSLTVPDSARYRLVREHARGGLGRVLEADDLRLERQVAVKELLERSDMAAALFVREAQITARLQHPGIVPVHDAGCWPSGEPYYVMKLVSGQSLRDIIRNSTSLEERLGLLSSLIAVVETIAYAHSEGVIHRDIKPSNVLIGGFGETVVVDWGLASDRRVSTADTLDSATQPAVTREQPRRRRRASQYTVAGKVVGTPAYMAPEQARGDQVDERADIYSLGALLYEVLAGQPPYDGEDGNVIVAQVVAGPPKPLEQRQPGVPPELLTIVDKAMAREPIERYATAKELAEELKRFQTGKLVAAHHYSPMTLLKRWIDRHRSTVAVAAGGLVIMAIMAVLGVQRIIDERNQAQTAQRAAEDRRNQLFFLQAQASLTRDPTAALAWLELAPVPPADHDRPRFGAARALVDEAAALGVARHVFRHGGQVYDVALSPDGKTAATAAQDGVRLWDLRTGTMRELAYTGQSSARVVFSPDGSFLAVTHWDGGGSVWRLADGVQRPLPPTREPIHEIRFLRGGTLLGVHAQRSREGIWLWDVASGQPTRAFEPAQPEAVQSILPVLVADGRVVAAAVSESEVAFFDAQSGQERARIAIPGEIRLLAGFPEGSRVLVQVADGALYVADMASASHVLSGRIATDLERPVVSADGHLFAAASADRTIHLLDLRTGRHVELSGHQDEILQIIISADGSFVISCGDDTTVRLWDVATGVAKVLRGHGDDVVEIALSQDSTTLASASLDGSARIWALERPRLLRAVGSPPGHLSLIGQQTLLSYAYGSDVRIWDLESNRMRLLGSATGEFQGYDEAPVVAPDGSRIALFADDGNVLLWDVASGQEQILPGPGLGPNNEPFMNTQYLASALAFSPGSDRLLASGPGDSVLLWDLATRQPTQLSTGKRAYEAVFSADGSRVLLALGNAIELWDISARKLVVEIARNAGATPWIVRLALSPDGRWAAASTSESELWLFDIARASARKLAAGDLYWPQLAFSPDSTELAVSWLDRSIRVWPVAGGEPRILAGHTDLIYDLAYASNGQYLISVSHDRTARLWNTRTGLAHVLFGHDSPVHGMAISADARTLVTAAQDGVIRFWDLARPRPENPAALRAHIEATTSANILPDDRIGTPPRP